MPATAPRFWFDRGWRAWLLLPFSALFMILSALRRFAYARGWRACHTVGVPVIVVGNIAVGGSGKTPAVVWLAAQLAEAGFTPGIISRGYGRRDDAVRCVDAAASVAAGGSLGACVCDLIEPSGRSQPTVSHHLKILREAGLVTTEKRGKWAWYFVVPERIGGLKAALG